MANITTLNMHNTNIRFISSETEASSLRYQKAYKNIKEDETCALDGYLFFDLYNSCIYLNGKLLSPIIITLKSSDGKLAGYKFIYKGEEFKVELSSISQFNEGGMSILADNVTGGLMSKADKVSIEYLKDQIGFSIEESDDLLKIIKKEAKFKPDMKWNEYSPE